MKRRLGIFSGEGGIEAVFGDPAQPSRTPGETWSGPFAALRAHDQVGRLLGAGALFDAELTRRWGRLVTCSAEFSAWWRAQPATPAPKPSFFLEVGSDE